MIRICSTLSFWFYLCLRCRFSVWKILPNRATPNGNDAEEGSVERRGADEVVPCLFYLKDGARVGCELKKKSSLKSDGEEVPFRWVVEVTKFSSFLRSGRQRGVADWVFEFESGSAEMTCAFTSPFMITTRKTTLYSRPSAEVKTLVTNCERN
jgi:hypothetical protein